METQVEDSGKYRIRLRDMAASERPQERLERLGPGALSDTELLAMLLRSGSSSQDVITLSSRLITEAGSLKALLTWSETDFQKMNGIGKVKALQLLTVMEIARRVLSTAESEDPLVLEEPQQVFHYFFPKLAGLAVERFYICALNRRNGLIRDFEITSGTATSSLVHPREVFRPAIQWSATAIIAVHNHPSGDPTPSPADIQVTRKLKAAAAALEVDFLDHVIIGNPGIGHGNPGYYSFSEAGLI
jgi:DNA repair protein RadC